MYEKFYNFTEKPFRVTPDTKFFFPSSEHRAALDTLVYTIQERKGFVVITGEIGAGKTTVCRCLLNRLGNETQTALIRNTHLSAKGLIASILDEFEIDFDERKTKDRLLSMLNFYLIEQLALDQRVLVIIDEAQNFGKYVLEELRMLSNLETEQEKLLQIVLLGQPELWDTLCEPKLKQLKQRVSLHYHIKPLSRAETKAYIQHRVGIVCSNGLDIFTEEALDRVYQYTEGIPRVVNLLCDSALLSGFVNETRALTKAVIDEAAGDVPAVRDRSEFDRPVETPDETHDRQSLEVSMHDYHT